MANKRPSSDLPKRDDGLPDDIFVTTVRRIISWSKENQQQVIVGGVAVVFILAAGWWFLASQRSVEAAAESQLARVQQTVASGNVQLAIRDLESFLASYGSTDAADQGRLTLASLLIDEGRADEAVDALGDLPQRLGSPYGLPGARLKASALEKAGRHAEAAATYEQIGDDARFTYQRREALADAARVHMQSGNPRAAVALYERVLETFEAEEAGRGYYDMWLAEARAQAASGQGQTAEPIPAPEPDETG